MCLRTEATLRPFSAAPAQHQPTGHTEEGRGIAEIHSQADLVLHPTEKKGIIKIHDHVVGGPGNGGEAEEAGAEETDPTAEDQGGFDH